MRLSRGSRGPNISLSCLIRSLLLFRTSGSLIFFYSADSAMIILLVKPPTHGWSTLKGFKGESVKF